MLLTIRDDRDVPVQIVLRLACFGIFGLGQALPCKEGRKVTAILSSGGLAGRLGQLNPETISRSIESKAEASSAQSAFSDRSSRQWGYLSALV